ncbi:hypothetical protein [Crateriforma spongiae]|uniref:hypothetical protein n=1 Tax=Crateriforma spongiae TaxID=2724528 RepID=UPI0014463887|nr:hypothetical protein [Crateriforma spongiae]
MNPPPSATRRNRRQISLSFMLLVMLIFALMSAGMLYASRVDAVQNELRVLFGADVVPATGDQGRLPHLVFILFTLTSPLILAGLLSTGLGIYRQLIRPR